jgi:hypothetical protein
VLEVRRVGDSVMVEIKGDCVGWTGIWGFWENVLFLVDFCTRWRIVDKDANFGRGNAYADSSAAEGK